MNKLSNILWRFFTSIVVFSCRTPADANAEEYATTHTLCRAGYYVSKCGEYNVGTNWLRGYPASENTVLVDATTQQTAHVERGATVRAGRYSTLISGIVNSPNYYDYSGINNLQNLRYFFGNDDGKRIVYTTSSGTRQVAEYAAYSDTRNKLLAVTCNPVNVQIVCSQCPGVATVPASTVDITYDSGLLVSDSWKFHTIADCFMQEFQDSTGIYEYVDDNNQAQNCYYSQDVGGDVLIDETTAGESQYES